jgi:hypothetical protein
MQLNKDDIMGNFNHIRDKKTFPECMIANGMNQINFQMHVYSSTFYSL